MKNIKKYLLCIIVTAVLFSGLTAYAVTSILGTNVFYDNKDTRLTSTDMQGAVDEIYDKAFKDSCYTNNKTKYTESILNGADPVLGQNMIPVTIAPDGKVTYANVNSKWYEYGQKQWANAVMLIDSPSKTYKECEEISNDDIKAYFVWVPRYKYKIWNTGNYNGYYQLSNLTDSSTDIETSLKNIANQAQIIEIIFESKTIAASTGSTVGSYLTHPAFTSFNINGFWASKFQASSSLTSITVKPEHSSITNQTVGAFWNAFYEFSRVNDSHMIKNTEWGVAAYLSHSIYGINSEVKTNHSYYCKEWNSLNGYTLSTTGNISGIYDMSGRTHEFVAGYMSGYGIKNSNDISSGFTSDPVSSKGTKYFDVYNNSSNTYYAFSNRKLGDATGEMGPFYWYSDSDNYRRLHNSWYGDASLFIVSSLPWFTRGSSYEFGYLAGQFSFYYMSGAGSGAIGSRLVLSPQ